MRNHLLFIIIFSSLSLFLIFSLVMPKYEKLSVLDQEIFEKDVELRSKEEYSKQLGEISEALKEKLDVISKIDSALPQGHGLPELLNFFQKAASQSGLILESVAPKYFPPEEGKKIGTSKVGLVLTGNYSSFKDFLSIIEKSARLIEVENISFSSPGKEGSFNFNIETMARSY